MPRRTPTNAFFAEGHLYRKASEQPSSLIVLLGTWLLICTFALGLGALLARTFLNPGIFWSGWQLAFALPLALGLIAISIRLLWKITRNYLNRPRGEAGES